MSRRALPSLILFLLAWPGSTVVAEAAPAPSPTPQILDRLSEAVEPWMRLSDGKAQLQTIRDCRDIGTALMAWVVDHISAAAAGADVVSMEAYPLSSYEEMKARLVPDYIQELPRTDGWGHPYEFRVAWDDPMADHVILVRSPGKDGEFSGTEYQPGSFNPDDADEDIVWGDGFFLRWPERQPEKEPGS